VCIWGEETGYKAINKEALVGINCVVEYSADQLGSSDIDSFKKRPVRTPLVSDSIMARNTGLESGRQ
jgi:hypothetical protein